MAKKFYITTPLYYVNSNPHIGHSYTNIAADTLARFMRQQIGEENVWFLTGTDEHGQKIQKVADAAGLSPLAFSDQMADKFKALWSKLEITYNDFIRTTEKRHIDFVQRALQILYDKGDIYSDKYEGWYCTPCETFWTGSQIVKEACPDCQRPVEKISETNFFFRMSKYQGWLMDHIDKNPGFIRPKSRYEEVRKFLELNKLQELCISRPAERLSWGIPLPFAPTHVTYVWFDALLNYASAVGNFDSSGKYVSKWWPADIQLIGKDILRQHAVYWPIMLHALDIAPAGSVFAHGWWLIDDKKMSKSVGNVVSPLDMADRFGIDSFRYFLLRDVPFGLDGNFSEESIIKRFNSDLANDLGNLVYRTLTMTEKYFAGKIPKPSSVVTGKALEIKAKIVALSPALLSAIGPGSECDFSRALSEIWELIGMANKYVEETKPWVLAKEDKQQELADFIAVLIEVIRKTAQILWPFMPRTAEKISSQIKEDRIEKGEPLFPRIEIKK